MVGELPRHRDHREGVGGISHPVSGLRPATPSRAVSIWLRRLVAAELGYQVEIAAHLSDVARRGQPDRHDVPLQRQPAEQESLRRLDIGGRLALDDVAEGCKQAINGGLTGPLLVSVMARSQDCAG